MPCLNEAKTIAACVKQAAEYLAKSKISGEVLVVDNGSSDNSVTLAEGAGARVVKELKKGYGAALICGIEEASGDYIIYGDCDQSYDFSDLTSFMSAFEQGADFVAGDRFAGGIAKGAMSLSHRLGVPVLSALARMRFHATIRDFHCGLRGIKREAAKSLKLQCLGMEFATEIVAKSVRQHLVIAEVPVSLKPDGRDGPPHLRTLRDGLRHLWFIYNPHFKKEKNK